MGAMHSLISTMDSIASSGFNAKDERAKNAKAIRLENSLMFFYTYGSLTRMIELFGG